MHLQAEVGVGLEGKEQTGPSREEPGGEEKPLTDAQITVYSQQSVYM